MSKVLALLFFRGILGKLKVIGMSKRTHKKNLRNNMQKKGTWWALGGILLLTVITVVFVFPQLVSFIPPAKAAIDKLNIKLGLDLQGGARLEYEAKTDSLASDQVQSALDAVQGVVERRVNAIGVGEPKVQQATSGTSHRIIVEIPGVSDVRDAKDKIKDAPLLEFREMPAENPEGQKIIDQLNASSKKNAEDTLQKALAGDDFSELIKSSSPDPNAVEATAGDLGFVSKGKLLPEFDAVLFEKDLAVGAVYPELVETDSGWFILKKEEERFVKSGTEEVVDGPGDGIEKQVHAKYIPFRKMQLSDIPELAYTKTGLTGQYLKSATANFAQQQYGLSEPMVSMQFNDEGAKMFEEVTRRNVGKPLAIFIDGELVTAPTVNDVIAGGQAQITGKYTLDQAKELARRLNEGALPVPLELVGEDIISPSLGHEELVASVKAGLMGLIAVILFVMVYYRLPGVIAGFALVLYSLFIITLFKLTGLGGAQTQITLTLSGIAGFILSVGMAIDANILIFERMKEELQSGKGIRQSTQEGFKRAWTSIRDSNLSTILTSLILIGVGTGFVQGFALVLMLGVIVSMFSAMFVTRVILLALPLEKLEKFTFLFLGKGVQDREVKNR